MRGTIESDREEDMDSRGFEEVTLTGSYNQMRKSEEERVLRMVLMF